MPPSRLALPFILSLFITLAHSHKDGEEYTYMSMFLKPQTPDMIEGDNHLGQVYEQLSIHNRIARPSGTRRMLRSESTTGDTQKDGEDPEEDDQDASTTTTSALPRMSMSDDSNVDVKVSRELFSEEDEEEEEGEDEEEEEEGGDEEEEEEEVEDNEKARGKEKGKGKEEGLLRRERIPSAVSKLQVTKQLRSEDNRVRQLGNIYGEDLDRIQQMLHKIIVKYDIQSMADVPCRAHAHWMTIFLDKLVQDKENFRYYCVDTRREVLKSMKKAIGDRVNSKFVLRRFWTQGIPRADLVFSWAGLDNMKPENVKKYLTRLSKTRDKHKLIAIGSHAGELKKKGSESMIARLTAGGRPVNVREPPFRLRRPMRIIGKLSTEGNDKQLYLYKADDMM